MKAFFSIHEINGDYRWACKNFEEMTGYNRKDVIGKSAYDFFNPKDVARIVKSHLNVIQESDVNKSAKITQQTVYRIRKKNGKYIWVISHTNEDEEHNQIMALTIKLNFISAFILRILV